MSSFEKRCFTNLRSKLSSIRLHAFSVQKNSNTKLARGEILRMATRVRGPQQAHLCYIFSVLQSAAQAACCVYTDKLTEPSSWTVWIPLTVSGKQGTEELASFHFVYEGIHLKSTLGEPDDTYHFLFSKLNQGCNLLKV